MVQLPVDAHSVPLVRALCRQALEHIGVQTTAIEEIALALTEACANVVQHAGDHEEYEVRVAIDDRICRITVLDDGAGFDPAVVAGDGPPSAGGGRGLVLMNALVDRLHFERAQDGRHCVTLEKQLQFEPKLRLLSPS